MFLSSEFQNIKTLVLKDQYPSEGLTRIIPTGLNQEAVFNFTVSTSNFCDTNLERELKVDDDDNIEEIEKISAYLN